jgi:6,7-dimethyl-8-ribityllumazine synthase
MSTSGGFWPGESPAEQEDVHEPETPVADPPGWPTPRAEEEPAAAQPAAEAEVKPATEQTSIAEPQPAEPEPAAEEAEAEPEVAPAAHVPGEIDIPDGVAVLEGSPSGADRTVGVVVSRFNGEISNRLLSSALEALAAAGVADERITVMPVPGAFELPIGAMALAKTRRYSCVIALGCVVRGETAHFDYVAGEAASGLQLAGLETGVPVAFGVLTVDTSDQAEARVDKGADAARAALEMADLFSQVRASAR